MKYVSVSRLHICGEIERIIGLVCVCPTASECAEQGLLYFVRWKFTPYFLHRQKIMTLCTIDVHNRDVVARLIAEKVVSSEAFTWLSQLRHRWDESDEHCYANICNAQFQYQYEYLGNTPRLVITPLTDRYRVL